MLNASPAGLEDAEVSLHSQTLTAAPLPYPDLARKALRSAKPQQEIVYEMTTDPGLIHQYCRLREEMFIRVWGLEHFTGQKEPMDDASHIVVARQGRLCIGGGRLTFTYPERRQRLPMEGSGLILESLFPELRLSGRVYCEVTRVAVLPEFRDGHVLTELVVRFIKKILAEQCEYGFFLAPLPLARNYRRVLKMLGYEWTIRGDLPIPEREEYEGIKMVLSSIDFSAHVQKRKMALQAASESPADMLEA